MEILVKDLKEFGFEDLSPEMNGIKKRDNLSAILADGSVVSGILYP